MNQIEENVVNSFRLAKSNIIDLQNKVIGLSQAQGRVTEMLNALHKDEVNLYNRMKKSKPKVAKKSKAKPKVKTIIKTIKAKPKVKTIVKTITKRASKVYVSSKDSNKFHLRNCPFAKNIKPKHKEVFKSKVKALNQGLKPCKCVA